MKKKPIVKIITIICLVAMLATAFIPIAIYIYANFFSEY